MNRDDLTLELLILAGNTPCACLQDEKCRRCQVIAAGERLLNVG